MKVRFLALGIFAVAISMISVGCGLESTGDNVVGLNALSTFQVTSVNNDPVSCVTLFAGQTIDVGTVCYEVAGTDLLVTYTLAGGWELEEAHLWVGCASGDYPSTNKGNPKIGNFPYNSGDITGTTSYTFTVPLDQFSCLDVINCDDGNILYAMAHAAVRKDNGDGTYQTETGWGNGPRVVERGSWAMQSTLTMFDDSCGGGPVDKCYEGETSIAYSDDGLCYLGLDADGDGNGDINRWGWSIPICGTGEFSYPIYAGAAQCDITKGTYVGDLIVNYDGTTVAVTYRNLEGYTFNEFHLWVGCTPLPVDATSGEYDAAFGQWATKYGGIGDELPEPGVTERNYSVDAPSCDDGCFYISAHAVWPMEVACE